MNVVYLAFGENIENHQQANFSILSLLANGGNFKRIIVVTDAPEYYKHIDSDQLCIELISEELLTQWKGEHNFAFRAKIKTLELIIDKHPNDSVLFLDTDTYVIQRLDTIQKQLSEGYYTLHLNEGRMSESNRKTQKSIWNAIKRKTFQNIKIANNLCMWNSGVIGIPALQNKAYIKTVLAVCDDLCMLDIKIKLMEQLAFSIVLQQQDKFIECEKEIGHYWGNKEEWNIKTNSFFLKNYLKKRTFIEQVSEIKTFDFQEIPVIRKTSNTAQRLKRMIDKIF